MGRRIHTGFGSFFKVREVKLDAGEGFVLRHALKRVASILILMLGFV
jgi:hypothetical protein